MAHIGWDGPSVNSPSWVIIKTFLIFLLLINVQTCRIIKFYQYAFTKLIFLHKRKHLVFFFCFQMSEFKTSPGFASAPMTLTGDAQNKAQDSTVKWTSEGIIFSFKHCVSNDFKITPK